MKKSYLGRLVLLTGLISLFISCSKEDMVTENQGKTNAATASLLREDQVYSGPKITIGEGYIRSWMSYNEYDIPIEIGVEMSPEVFNNIEANFEKPIYIPLQDDITKVTPFDHIEIDWHAQDESLLEDFKPAHFAFYFFMIPLEKRNSIPEWSPETDFLFSMYPPKINMAQSYVPLERHNGSYASLGKYWLSKDPRNYQPLSHTLVLGTFEGQFVFIDPIVTWDQIKAQAFFNENYPQPLVHISDHLFPREYNFYVNSEGNYCITLGNFITR